MNIDLRDFLPDLWPMADPLLINGIIAGQDEAWDRTGMLDDRLAILHFMAQISAETNGGTVLRESLYYKTAQRLREVWPRRFASKTDDELRPLLRNTNALANAVYMGRIGNLQPGDGAKFAGKGLLQTTGRQFYEHLGTLVGLDLVAHPEYVIDPNYALLCAAVDFVEICNALPHARNDDLLAVSGMVNVGKVVSASAINGWSHRKSWYNKWNAVL